MPLVSLFCNELVFCSISMGNIIFCPGFDRGAITDEKYRSFLDAIQQKMSDMSHDVQKVKVSRGRQRSWYFSIIALSSIVTIIASLV
jgi:hypothetical protein